MIVFGRYIRYKNKEDFDYKLEKTNYLINSINLNENEYKIINYFDEKSSEINDTRKNLNRMIQDIKEKKFDILVAPSINNISRNNVTFGKILHELSNNKMRIVTKDLDLSCSELDFHSKIYNSLFNHYKEVSTNYEQKYNELSKGDNYEL